MKHNENGINFNTKYKPHQSILMHKSSKGTCLVFASIVHRLSSLHSGKSLQDSGLTSINL